MSSMGLEELFEEAISAIKKRDERIARTTRLDYINILYRVDKQQNQHIDNQSYDGTWDGEMQDLFDFLYYNAQCISPFEHVDIFIESDKSYYELGEVSGQGCYQYIRKLNCKPRRHTIQIDDIFNYSESNAKPKSAIALDLINRSFSILECALGSDYIDLDGETINIYEIHDYIRGKILE